MSEARTLENIRRQPLLQSHISHQLSAAACDAPHPAVFSRLGVLDVPQVRALRPSGRKPHWARHLAGLATKPGKICGLYPVSPFKCTTRRREEYGFSWRIVIAEVMIGQRIS